MRFRLRRFAELRENRGSGRAAPPPCIGMRFSADFAGRAALLLFLAGCSSESTDPDAASAGSPVGAGGDAFNGSAGASASTSSSGAGGSAQPVTGGGGASSSGVGGSAQPATGEMEGAPEAPQEGAPAQMRRPTARGGRAKATPITMAARRTRATTRQSSTTAFGSIAAVRRSTRKEAARCKWATRTIGMA